MATVQKWIIFPKQGVDGHTFDLLKIAKSQNMVTACPLDLTSF